MIGFDGEISISELFGLIGEHCTEKYLTANMDCFIRADRSNFLASSFLSPHHRREFDISDLHDLTQKCQKHGKLCEFDKRIRPCLKPDFFEPNYDPLPYMNLHETGDDKIRWYCALRFSHLAIQHYDGLLTDAPGKFLTDHLVVHFYLDNLGWGRQIIKEKYPFDGAESNRFQKGYPGRLDYFAKGSGSFFCIDSKVNTARLNLSQQIRMAWMQRCGHKSQISHVSFVAPDKERVREVYLHDGIEAAVDLVKPTLEIIDYDQYKFPIAERIVNDRDAFLVIAKHRFGFIPQRGIDYFIGDDLVE